MRIVYEFLNFKLIAFFNNILLEFFGGHAFIISKGYFTSIATWHGYDHILVLESTSNMITNCS